MILRKSTAKKCVLACTAGAWMETLCAASPAVVASAFNYSEGNTDHENSRYIGRAT